MIGSQEGFDPLFFIRKKPRTFQLRMVMGGLPQAKVQEPDQAGQNRSLLN